MLVAVVLALAAAACNGGADQTATPTPTATESPAVTPTDTPAQTPTSTPTAAPTATPGPGETPAAEACAAEVEGGDFRQDGELLSASGDGDARNVGAFRWQRHRDVCERFVIDLVTEDGAEAAEAGDVRVELIRELGVIRATLQNVTTVEPIEETDAEFDGPLAIAAYAVRDTDGAIYVDLHMGKAAEARAFVLSSPARVVIDLRSGGTEIPPPAARDRNVVVLSPRADSASYPLEITGYARTFEANVIARIRQDGEVEAETFTTATDWTSTWGEFTLTLEGGPAGEVELFVGEESARDGTEEGVRLDLTME